MLTLTQLKNEFGIKVSDTSRNDELTRVIGEATGIIRGRIRRYLFGCATQLDDAGDDVRVTSPGHGLVAGQQLILSGSNIDGQYVAANVTRDTFTIVCATTTPGETAVIHPIYAHTAVGSGHDVQVVPHTLVPFQSVLSVGIIEEMSLTASLSVSGPVLDDPFVLPDGWVELDVDVNYVVVAQDQIPRAAVMHRIDGCSWNRFANTRGMLISRTTPSIRHSVCVAAAIGAPWLPYELQSAIGSICSDIYEGAGRNKTVDQTFDGVSRSHASGEEREQRLLSAWRIIDSWASKI